MTSPQFESALEAEALLAREMQRRVGERPPDLVAGYEMVLAGDDGQHLLAADGDTLALAAGGLAGPPLQQLFDLDHSRRLGDARGDLCLWQPSVFQPEGESPSSSQEEPWRWTWHTEPLPSA